jgi:hypothetical protein
MNTQIQANQDKRGFYHSCDRETYRKLRRVRHFLHWQRIQANRHLRWSAKLPHNRVKWVFDGLYLKQGLDISFTKWKSEPWAEPPRCPVNLDQMYRDYLTAREGHQNPDDAQPIVLSAEAIDAISATCENWLKEI